MATTTELKVDGADPVITLRGFLKTVLEDNAVSALFVPMRQGDTGALMPALITDPERLDLADPFAPANPLNAARMVARLTHGEAESGRGLVAAVLRPCEIRAFIELVKLNQGSLEGVLLIGADCYGAFTNAGYRVYAQDTQGHDSTIDFMSSHDASGLPRQELGLSRACMSCEHPSPDGADIAIELFGTNPFESIPVTARTPRGEGLLNRLGLPGSGENTARKQALADLRATRVAYRDAMFAQTAEQTSDLDKLSAYLSGCVNCYNCRVACPVCYCRECVFVTDVFEHQPWQYLNWARAGGSIKMPTDTVFFHLTRLAHMSTACVGCGQCSNACPNGVQVMELFRMIAAKTQEAFEYEAGRSAGEAPPLTVFHEKEFADVTGGAG